MKTVRCSFLPTVNQEMEREVRNEVIRYLKQRGKRNAYTLFRVMTAIQPWETVGNIVAIPNRYARRFAIETENAYRL